MQPSCLYCSPIAVLVAIAVPIAVLHRCACSLSLVAITACAYRCACSVILSQVAITVFHCWLLLALVRRPYPYSLSYQWNQVEPSK